MIKRIISLLCFVVALIPAEACTSAVVSARASRYGRPMLWKHRDTSTVDNKVEYVAPRDGGYGYVALFNASDKHLEEAWTGMNEVGFAIMNTASYNIKDDKVPEKQMDKEGYVMTIALRTCRNVEDFARLLDTLPRPMGVEANFGVIDAEGNGAVFETNNHSYVRYNLDEAADGILIRTNYSHSGRPDEGYGFVREANAEHILRPYAEKGDITPELLTEVASRSFYHDLKQRDYSDGSERWVIDQDFIPRYKSTAVIVIEGCKPLADASQVKAGDLKDEYIMWTGLGYPPCSEIVPVWCAAEGVEKELRGLGEEGRSEMCDRVKQRRSEVFPIRKGNGEKYIDITTLFNASGTGYVQVLVPQNLATYERVREMRDSRVKSSSGQ